MKKLCRLLPWVVGLTPMMALAATLQDVITTAKTAVDSIVPLFTVIAVAVFLWGIVKYVTAGGDPEKEKAARGSVVYGLIGIFVLVAFWGIIQMMASTLGITTGGATIPVPVLP